MAKGRPIILGIEWPMGKQTVIIDDPKAIAAINAQCKKDCRKIIELHKDRVEHFAKRMAELDYGPEDVVIGLINVDSWRGKDIAEVTMPGHDWDQYRKQGLTPYARGLIHREAMQRLLETQDEAEAKKMKEIKGTIIWVQDFDVFAVFEYPLKDE